MIQTVSPLHTLCMTLLGGNTAVAAGIFYTAWGVHLLEAFYALSLLARHPGWMRTSTAVPWFVLTCAPEFPARAASVPEARKPARQAAHFPRFARSPAHALRPRRTAAPSAYCCALSSGPGRVVRRFLFGYPQLCRLMRADKERRLGKPFKSS
jgi:hypothetical protein